jgi:hypothetical protein
MARLPRLAIPAGALLAWALSAAAAAHGAIPVAPPDGAKVSSRPTLAWGPAPGDGSNQIELSPNPALADDGSFVDDPRKRKASLDDVQTSYTVAPSEPLVEGTWYWHVEVLNFDVDPCCSSWTQTRRIQVQDEPIRLSSFKVGFLRGLDEIVLRIGYSDNSANLAARYRLVFKRRRHGRALAHASGNVDKGSFQGAAAFESVRRPKRLKRGRRYLVQLELRDAAGHVARSHYVRIRL